MPTCKACGADVVKARDTAGNDVLMDAEVEVRGVVGHRVFGDGTPQVERRETRAFHRNTCTAGGMFPADPPTSSQEARERAEQGSV